MTTDQDCPRLVITPGEPAGIGPDIVVAAVTQNTFNAEIVAVSDPDLLMERADLLNQPLQLEEFNPDIPAQPHNPGTLKIIPVTHQIQGKTGQPHPGNAAYVLETLELACKGCLRHQFDAMITAPVNKAIINSAGIPFSGHTEYLAEICGNAFPVMMLADQKLRIALVTTHIPLSSVSKSITPEKLDRVINILQHDLVNRFNIQQPDMLVCGLNPHAGENGFLGKEELEIISPVLEKLKSKGLHLTGPVPADTAFSPENLESFDVIITMYHDQGLPVIKSRNFGEIVNITLGLPIIRTSVDHGTALSLAGTGRANCSSLVSAINIAIQLCLTTGKNNNPGFCSEFNTSKAV